MSLGYEQGSGVSRNEKLGHSAVGGQVGVLSGGLGFELHEALLCSCPQPRVAGEVNTEISHCRLHTPQLSSPGEALKTSVSRALEMKP